MRAINFMKIDYMLTRQQQRILPLMLLVAVFVGRTLEEEGLIVACSYLIFIGTIFATVPFGYCNKKNTGFLLMLPSTVTERVLGRFLFGLSYIAMMAVLCVAAMGVFYLFGFEVAPVTVGLLLCNMALGLIIVALEYLLSYIFGEGKNNWQYVGNLVRVAPAMVMYFVFMHIAGRMVEEDYVADRMTFLAHQMIFAGAVALGVSLLVMAVAAIVCVKVIEKRDYA